MSSVTFSTAVGGDGSTVTDDTNPTTGLDGGGHRVRFVPSLAQTVAVAAHTVNKASEALASQVIAQEQAGIAAGQVAIATAQASAAATSAGAASASASTATAQAVSAAASATSAGTAATAAANVLISAAAQRPAIKPSVSVDWTLKPTAASLIAAGWTISRASEMTYFGQAPVKVGENLLTQSRSFGASWSTTTRPVTLTPVTHPSGLAGFNVAGTTSPNAHALVRGYVDGNFLPSQTYRLRFLARSGAYTKCLVSDTAAGRAVAHFDLATGAPIPTSSGLGYVSHSITPHELGGGLYWCELVMTTVPSGSWTINIAGYPDTGATFVGGEVTYTGDGTSGIEVYAAQLQHNFDGHFVETTTTPVTLYASPLLTAPANELAYQHNTNGECVGLLSYQEAATNLCLQSQGLTSSPWSGSGVTPALTKRFWANSSPFYRLVNTTSVDQSRWTQACFTPGAASTFSLTLALLGDYWSQTTSVGVGLNGSENASWGADTDSNFVILSGPGTAARNSGSRVNVTGLSYTTPTVLRITRTYPLAELTPRAVTIYPGTHTSTTIGAAILATRVQVEAGPRATPYIPTTTATVTRAVQSVVLEGAAFANVGNQTQGTLLVRASVEDMVFDTRTVLLTNYNSISAWRHYVGTNNSGAVAAVTTNALVQQASLSVGAFSQSPITAAYAYATNSFQLAAGGALSALDTNGSLPPVNRISSNWAGLIQRTELYPRAMTAAELAAITTPGVLV